MRSGVVRAEPQRPVGVALAPARIAEDVVGVERAALAHRETIGNRSVVWLTGPARSVSSSASISGNSSAMRRSGWTMRPKSSPYSSRVKTTPDGEDRIAAKSALPSAWPARRTASG